MNKLLSSVGGLIMFFRSLALTLTVLITALPCLAHSIDPIETEHFCPFHEPHPGFGSNTAPPGSGAGGMNFPDRQYDPSLHEDIMRLREAILACGGEYPTISYRVCPEGGGGSYNPYLNHITICTNSSIGWQTILIHELVHVYQEECTNQYQYSLNICERAVKNELEAYYCGGLCDNPIDCCIKAANSSAGHCGDDEESFLTRHREAALTCFAHLNGIGFPPTCEVDLSTEPDPQEECVDEIGLPGVCDSYESINPDRCSGDQDSDGICDLYDPDYDNPDTPEPDYCSDLLPNGGDGICDAYQPGFEDCDFDDDGFCDSGVDPESGCPLDDPDCFDEIDISDIIALDGLSF